MPISVIGPLQWLAIIPYYTTLLNGKRFEKENRKFCVLTGQQLVNMHMHLHVQSIFPLKNIL